MWINPPVFSVKQQNNCVQQPFLCYRRPWTVRGSEHRCADWLTHHSLPSLVLTDTSLYVSSVPHEWLWYSSLITLEANLLCSSMYDYRLVCGWNVVWTSNPCNQWHIKANIGLVWSWLFLRPLVIVSEFETLSIVKDHHRRPVHEL